VSGRQEVALSFPAFLASAGSCGIDVDCLLRFALCEVRSGSDASVRIPSSGTEDHFNATPVELGGLPDGVFLLLLWQGLH